MNNKKLLTGIFIGIFIITLASALTFKQNQEVDLKIVCINAGYCSSSSVCNVSIFAPDETTLLSSVQATQSADLGSYNITLNASSTSQIGEYIVGGFCKDGSVTNIIDFTFEVTSTGFELTTARGIVFVSILAVLIFLFVVTLGGFSMLPSSNTRNEEGELMSINNLKHLRSVLLVVGYLLLIAISFLSSNISLAYLGTTLFGDIMFVIFQILFVLALPMFIIWLLYIFSTIFRDKEMKKIMQRGITMGGGV